jgi:hypothetical protein
MFKRVILISISLLLAFSLCAFSPQTASAAVTTSKLTITNLSGSVVTVTFSGGPRYYRVTANPGKTYTNVEKGDYTIRMNPCGAWNIEGKVSAQRNNSVLKIAKCSLFKVNNHTGGYVTVNLSGVATYRFTAGQGLTTFKVYKGSYDLKAYGCGGSSLSKTINLNKNQTLNLWCVRR